VIGRGLFNWVHLVHGTLLPVTGLR
jgi:hypothetical protein